MKLHHKVEPGEKRADPLPLHADAAAMNQPHLRKPARPRLEEVLARHILDLGRAEGVEVEGIGNRDFDRVGIVQEADSMSRAGATIGSMETAKEQVRQILQNLPEDASLEDIQYHIYVCQKIQQGVDDDEAGRVISHAEVQERLAKWLTK